MPAKKQTIASAKYQSKVGLISKSYKLKKELVEEFAKACADSGTSQSAAISECMKEYIRNTKMS